MIPEYEYRTTTTTATAREREGRTLPAYVGSLGALSLPFGPEQSVECVCRLCAGSRQYVARLADWVGMMRGSTQRSRRQEAAWLSISGGEGGSAASSPAEHSPLPACPRCLLFPARLHRISPPSRAELLELAPQPAHKRGEVVRLVQLGHQLRQRRHRRVALLDCREGHTGRASGVAYVARPDHRTALTLTSARSTGGGVGGGSRGAGVRRRRALKSSRDSEGRARCGGATSSRRGTTHCDIDQSCRRTRGTRRRGSARARRCSS